MGMFNRPLAGRLLISAAICAIALPSAAYADPTIVNVNASFYDAPISFTLGDSTFTFTGTHDWFSPTAVSTSGTGEINTIFGMPTSDFVNRNTVTFGPNDQYASFANPTTISYSNSFNFIGLRATDGANVYYGYAFTTDDVLNSYGFEMRPGAAVTATTAQAVPEPASWALMLGGFGLVGGTMRARRRSVSFA